MTTFLEKYKTKLIIFAILLAILLSGLYLYATGRRGIWLNDAFLYQEDACLFRGSDSYAQYTLQIDGSNEHTIITVTINDITRVYEVLCNDLDVQILQDGILVFDGSVLIAGDTHILQSSDDSYNGIDVSAGGRTPITEELFPSFGRLYSLAHSPETSTRGHPWMLALAWLFAAWIIVDICFPDFFFDLRYRWHIDGGEPSDIYRKSQTIARAVMLIFIIVILIVGLNFH
ncbi:MAG: hypothetical protein J6K03_02915 [Oscillospiraceae bacterium]|nr:hypothetical protein [Oscillospiraceae bacterium]